MQTFMRMYIHTYIHTYIQTSTYIFASMRASVAICGSRSKAHVGSLFGPGMASVFGAETNDASEMRGKLDAMESRLDRLEQLMGHDKPINILRHGPSLAMSSGKGHSDKPVPLLRKMRRLEEAMGALMGLVRSHVQDVKRSCSTTEADVAALITHYDDECMEDAYHAAASYGKKGGAGMFTERQDNARGGRHNV